MSALFSPATLRGVTLRNRIVVSPMCQYSAERGEANDMAHDPSRPPRAVGRRDAVHRGHRRRSRMAASRRATSASGTTPPKPRSSRVLAAIRKHSTIAVAMQLAHAGRKASSHVPWEGGQLIPFDEGGWLPFAPSAVPHKEGEDAAARARRGRPAARARRFRRAPRSARNGSASMRSSCMARTAICCTSSCRRSPTGAPTSTAARSKTACAFRSRSSMRCAPRSPPTSRSAYASRRPTGSTAAGTSSRRSCSRRN